MSLDAAGDDGSLYLKHFLEDNDGLCPGLFHHFGQSVNPIHSQNMFFEKEKVKKNNYSITKIYEFGLRLFCCTVLICIEV